MQLIKRGDTIVEVSIAITIFAMVAALSISMMNSGMATAQGAMESSMARNEIDAQAEAIRYIHDSYAAERSLTTGSQKYRDLWRTLTDANHSLAATSLPPLQHNTSCPTTADLTSWNAYIINTRHLSDLELSLSGKIVNNTSVATTILNGSTLQESSLYPRVIFSLGAFNSDDNLSESGDYTTVARAEGIWVITSAQVTSGTALPEFYDFHIYTCWFAPGRSNPSTIGTIVRLYNPELVGTNGVDP